MRTVERTCWWCGKKLMAVSHAEVKDRDGNVVRVHVQCEVATRESMRDYTAAPTQIPAHERNRPLD